MKSQWWACDRCGERQLTQKKGKRCAMTVRCDGRLTADPYDFAAGGAAAEQKR